jgi:hypothetical protein
LELQVFVQPVFAFAENWAVSMWPSARFLTSELQLCHGFFKLNLFKLAWRTAFVACTTLVSMLLPFFNDVLGLLGASAFWPLTVYFPIAMHIARHQLKPWSTKWLGLQALSVASLLVSLAAALGSIAGIVDDLKHYTPFKTT